jgi:hypothetical protein
MIDNWYYMPSADSQTKRKGENGCYILSSWEMFLHKLMLMTTSVTMSLGWKSITYPP